MSISIISGLLLHSIYLFFTSGKNELGKEDALPSSRKKVETFHRVHLLLKDLDGPDIKLDSTYLEMIGEGEKAFFENPRGQIYQLNNLEGVVNIKADTGEYLAARKLIGFSDNVEFLHQKNELHCDRGVYQLDQERFEGRGHVNSTAIDEQTRDKVLINSDKVVSFPYKKYSQFSGDVVGFIERYKRYEGRFDFKADRIDVDLLKSLITLNENVWVKRENMDITARNSYIYLENFNKKLNYYELNDNVEITQLVKESGKKAYTRKAYSQKLEGFIKSKKVVLTGAPRVVSESDIIRGSRITLRENASLIEVMDSTSSIKIKE